MDIVWIYAERDRAEENTRIHMDLSSLQNPIPSSSWKRAALIEFSHTNIGRLKKLHDIPGLNKFKKFLWKYLPVDYFGLISQEVPLRDHSGGRPKCSHPLKSVEELTGVVVVIMFGFSHTFGIRWLLTFSLVDPVN
ncbi:hypothetical protein BDB01DRAFT_839445 [Pilobolus umbonatus]|nr:hypothetical protein BDB01DRAFT_839445 [Pilobolus umbonatus]